MTNSAVNEFDDDLYKPCIDKDDKQVKKAGLTDYMLMLSQIGLLLVWTFFAKFDQGVLPGTTKAPTNSNVYPCF